MNTEQDIVDNNLKNNPSDRILEKKGKQRKLSWSTLLSFLVLIFLIGGAIYQYQKNSHLHRALVQQKMALAQALQNDTQAKSFQSTMGGQVAAIEKTLNTLSTFYQHIHNSEIQHLLADTEQTLTMASEALYVINDTSAALKLLRHADSTIQRANQPELVPLHAALQRDIQILNALPKLDLAKEVARIDILINQVDLLPLNIDIQRQQADKKLAVGAETHLPWWKQIGQNIWQELRALVQIRRLDKPQQALLAVEQEMVLRENIKLRLVSARIALMTRNQSAYQADLQAVKKYITDYFDQSPLQTKQFVDNIQNLVAIQLITEKPMFTALEVLRSVHMASLPKGE